jgi:hypothetical protein
VRFPGSFSLLLSGAAQADSNETNHRSTQSLCTATRPRLQGAMREWAVPVGLPLGAVAPSSYHLRRAPVSEG